MSSWLWGKDSPDERKSPKKKPRSPKKKPKDFEEDMGTEMMEPALSQVFTMYLENNTNKQIRMFHSSGANSSIGGLFWCDVGMRQKGDESFELGRLTDIYLGKRTPVLKGPGAVNADSDCCLSLLSVDGTWLHLEAQSKDARTSWLERVKPILTGGGKKIVEQRDSPDPT